MTDPREIARRARAIADKAAAARTEPLLSEPGTPLPGGAPRGLRDAVAAFRDSAPVDPRRRPVGLVLAGGGAKGAYHAGAVQYLAEQNAQIVAVAGASVGALNGSLVAAAATLPEAAAALQAVWREAAADTGPPRRGDGDLLRESLGDIIANLPGRLSGPMLRRGYLDGLVERHLDPAALRDGLPLFVSVFRSQDPTGSSGNPLDLLVQQSWDGPARGGLGSRFSAYIDVLASLLGAESEWLLVNDMPADRMVQAILASAAIPLVMAPRNVDGVTMRDGGVLGRGNVPVGALAGRLDRVIAVHLEPLPLFHARQFADLDVIEVIPGAQLAPGGPLGAVSASLDLSPARVEALIELGYADAKRKLEAVWAQDAAEQVAGFLDDRRGDAVRELDEPLTERTHVDDQR